VALSKTTAPTFEEYVEMVSIKPPVSTDQQTMAGQVTKLIQAASTSKDVKAQQLGKKMQADLNGKKQVALQADIAAALKMQGVSKWGSGASTAEVKDFADTTSKAALAAQAGKPKAPPVPTKSSAIYVSGMANFAAAAFKTDGKFDPKKAAALIPANAFQGDKGIQSDAAGILSGNISNISKTQWGSLCTGLVSLCHQEAGPTGKGKLTGFNSALESIGALYGPHVESLIKQQVENSPFAWSTGKGTGNWVDRTSNKPKLNKDLQSYFADKAAWPSGGAGVGTLVSRQGAEAAALIPTMKGHIDTLALDKATTKQVLSDATGILNGTNLKISNSQYGSLKLVLAQAQKFDPHVYSAMTKSLTSLYGADTVKSVVADLGASVGPNGKYTYGQQTIHSVGAAPEMKKGFVAVGTNTWTSNAAVLASLAAKPPAFKQAQLPSTPAAAPAHSPAPAPAPSRRPPPTASQKTNLDRNGR
jgi:hypothetical protein